jgi:hypothetical protein
MGDFYGIKPGTTPGFAEAGGGRTESVYRHQLRPVLRTAATVLGPLFVGQENGSPGEISLPLRLPQPLRLLVKLTLNC